MTIVPPELEEIPAPAEQAVEEPRGRLRVTAARGTLVNAVFDIVLQGLAFLKGFIVAAFLTQSQYGLWGILVISLGTLSWLKQSGISEKYVQQDAEDQELAFQRAFTVEATSNVVMALILAVMLPVFVVLYGQSALLAPGIVLIVAVLAQSFRAPSWIYYREMRYTRQRVLDAADPLVSLVVTIALAVAGLGYWSLVIGYVSGVVAGGVVAVAMSPYKLRFRHDAATLREYFAFSWPLFVAGGAGLVIPQVSMLAGEAKLGLAGAGTITLAGTISVYTARVDQIVTWTLYPAICRVKDRTDVLFEAFVKTNRLALMWGVPFGVGVALFAADLIHYGIGDHWRPALHLVQAFGLIAAADHVAFNWAAFLRARGITRPLAVITPLVMVVFLATALPGLLLFGLDGYAVGMALMACAALAARTWVIKRRLFPQFRILRHGGRALAPTLPAAAAVLLLRLVLPDHSLAVALTEAAVYVAVTAAFTLILERALLREVVGYVRGKTGLAQAPA
ncbi:MAG: polysaccharide transporter, family [Thermoleophilaceae bacterium]|nr:polysaccharide transporter, family [Thermoleophilaceae bacterium]